MELPPPAYLFISFIILIFSSQRTLTQDPACRNTCNSLQIKYPFGTGPGCGSPLFHPYITCTSSGGGGGDQLILKTHTGSYPITSISYTTSTLTINPPYMSTCTSMQNSPNLGLDWASPFQIGPSTFILLDCQPPTSSMTTTKNTPLCDPSYSFLCASIYTCPDVVSLGLPLFPPTNTCCVYSPANLNEKGELDLRALKCGAYTSAASLGEYPIDPVKWVYGVVLKYTYGTLDNNVVDSKCKGCEISGGVCGYNPSGNSFICVCGNGLNSSLDCFNYGLNQVYGWSTNSSVHLLTRNI
ncbi:Wall-associated receptor kinase-like [Quillaja saponaria]|uniref:non-specific serine/threonine protein kinase n=1 Tax=Quillaja saponaria TaxID=32244 RepID=A0AAD7P7Z1_QUISA|nr:Wall-associated receptor kinase-like [Quillaja saponaria]